MSHKVVRFILFAACLGIGVTTWRVYAFMCTIDRYELDYSGPLSSAGFNAIQLFLSQHTQTSLTEISQRLVDTFPFIDSATLQRMPNRTVRVWITIPEPCAQLNDTLLLFSSGARCPTDFVHHPISLPQIMVPETIINTRSHNHAIAQFVHTAPKELFTAYVCEFHAPSYIKLSAHDQSHKIICLPTIQSQALNLCQHLIYEQQSNKKAKKWIGDIRFKNQIILQKEGGGHGTNS